MGILKIEMFGSFPPEKREFRADRRGHAVAVDEAITYLKGIRDSAAQQDVELRADGHVPNDRFNEAVKRELIPKD